MIRRRVLPGVGFLLVVLLVGALGFWLGRQQPAIAPHGERQVLYWYDPMVPDTHFDKPGKSPFMDMELVPRYAGEPEAATSVAIDSGVVQNLGIRLASVERTSKGSTIRAAGVLVFNDRALSTVQAKQDGFVERGHGKAIGDIVQAGDALVELRVPVWSGAIAEYLALRGESDARLVDAARRRLGALGVPDDAIEVAEQKGTAPSSFTIRAPASGALVSLDARSGAALGAGASIATISGLSPVWLVVSVPQGSIGTTRPGSAAATRFPSFPDEDFLGRVDVVLPGANAANRTIEVRVALDNRDGRLRPGMTGEVALSATPGHDALTIPSEAVIRTGLRNLVIVSHGDGRFEPVEVTLGAAAGDRLEITSGVSEGQKVVASGQFLIDSEANLSGAMERLRGASSAPVIYESTGRVTAIDANGVTIAHAPLPPLNWPDMTMAFGWGAIERNIAVGDNVAFAFRKIASGFELTSLRKTGDPQ